MSVSECIFCRIARGEMASRVWYEDGDAVAILDINPFERGHSLVIPKVHGATLLELPEGCLSGILPLVRRLAGRLVERLGADGFNVLQNNGRCASQSVDHVHFHLIPRYAGRELNWVPKVGGASAEELDELLKLLRG